MASLVGSFALKEIELQIPSHLYDFWKSPIFHTKCIIMFLFNDIHIVR